MPADARLDRPRRSVLYVPGGNARAVEKARTLPADGLIFDLEDGVLPDRKAEARTRVTEALRAGGYGGRELIVRVNAPGTEWFADDAAAAAPCGADAVLLPKSEHAETVRGAAAALEAAGAPPALGLWCMLETPLGILNAREIAAAHPRLRVFCLGMADLAKALHADLYAPARAPLLTAISLAVLAARAEGLAILDSPFFDLADEAGFLESCRQGRAFGFDGKTLLHPKTIAPANAVFGPSAEDLDHARRVIAAFEAAAAEGKGVALLDGRLVEALHVEEARALLAMAERIAALEAAAG